MKLVIYAVGSVGAHEGALIADYVPLITKAEKHIGLGAPQLTELKTQESFLKALDKLSSPFIVALDEKGETYTSREFANELKKWSETGASHLCFLIGGADGLGNEVLARADVRLSLSALTLPHRLARVILYEQLWRALSIITNHPYHRD